MNTFDIIGCPINLGCDRNGAELSPELLRRSGCFATQLERVIDLGDIKCVSREDLIAIKYQGHSRIKFLEPILEFSSQLAKEVATSIRNVHIPICIGGDHVMSFGSLAGVGLEKDPNNYAVIYIDAHGDFNTEITSSTGNMHGMHLSFLMGYGEKSISNFWGKTPLLRPENIYFCGVRALDEGEKKLADELGMNIITSEDLNKGFSKEIVDNMIKEIKRKGINHVHLSFDVDVIDPEFAPGTGVREDNGISQAIAFDLISYFMSSGLVASVDLVEFNPLLDIDGKTESIIKDILKIILAS